MRRIQELISIVIDKASIRARSLITFLSLSNPWFFGACLLVAVSTGISTFLILGAINREIQPHEFLGSYAYFSNLNISTRLFALASAVFMTVISFFLAVGMSSKDESSPNTSFVASLYVLVGAPILYFFVSIFDSGMGLDPNWFHAATIGLWSLILIRWLSGNEEIDLTAITGTLLLSWLVPAAGATLFRFLSGAWNNPNLLGILPDSALSYYAVPGFISLVLIFTARLKMARSLQKLFWMFTQVSLLFLLLGIIPSAVLRDGSLHNLYSVSPLLIAGVGVLVFLGCIEIYRQRSQLDSTSSIALLAVLVYLFFPVVPIPEYASNTYEFGHRYPVFWSIITGQTALFSPANMPYGLWDFLQFWLGSLGGSTLPTMAPLGTMVFSILLVAFEYFVLASAIDKRIAFLIVLATGIGTQTLIVGFFAVIFHPRLLQGRPVLWFVVWLALCSVLPFLKSPQGTMAVISTLPLFLVQAWSLFKENRKVFFVMAGGAILLLTIVAFGPFSGSFWGLIRLILEGSRMNADWAGNGWSFNGSTNLQSVLGNLVLAVPLVSILLAFGIHKAKQFKHSGVMATAIFLALATYVVVGISYGFARTDERPFARQLQMLLSVAPFLLFLIAAYIPGFLRFVLVTSGAVVLLLINVNFDRSSPRDRYASIVRSFQSPARAMESGESYGLAHLGTGVFPPGYLQSESALKAALDQVLDKDETFLNLTLDGGHYYSAQRRIITEWPNYYNYITESSQLRDVGRMENDGVTVTLANPGAFDGTPAPLRSYYLYRYALLKGIPLDLNNQFVLFAPAEAYDQAKIDRPSFDAALSTLDRLFPLRELGSIPHVWGNARAQLFTKELPQVTFTIERMQDGLLDISFPSPIKGVDAAFLALEFMTTNPLLGNELGRVSWDVNGREDPRNHLDFSTRIGNLIIPLDVSPRWLLAEGITRIRVDLGLAGGGASPHQQGALIPTSQANVESIGPNRFRATTGDSQLVYPLLGNKSGVDLEVKLEIEVSNPTKAQLFYPDQAGNLSEERSTTQALQQGLNVLSFHVKGQDLGNFLRLDPMDQVGDFSIRTIEIVPADNGVGNLTKIANVELRQRFLGGYESLTRNINRDKYGSFVLKTADLSDVNWDHGKLRGGSKFLVERTDEGEAALRGARRLEIGGTVVTVSGIEIAREYIVVDAAGLGALAKSTVVKVLE